MMLKIILSSGLYPHIAIADEFNSCKVKIILIDFDLFKTTLSLEICLVIPVYANNNTDLKNQFVLVYQYIGIC